MNALVVGTKATPSHRYHRPAATFKGWVRQLTGKGGALNRASTSREICQLSTLALAARVSIWDLD
jgi:homoserine acetyltransferase